ncbi:MAG: tetratricopeptide repeat protein [Treponema sp.]|jgi:tetratricopeptide (TPR) repeat protein|nr:tetratricopeptide repeat protein [Treponema sp.]
MPSLKALAEFKASFRSIGNEVAVTSQKNLPMEELDLPASEPKAMSSPGANQGDSGKGAASGLPPADPQNQDGFGGDIDEDDFSFGDLLGTALDNLSMPDPGLTDASEETAGEDEMPDAELPSLEGLTPPEAEEAEVPEAEPPSFEDLNIPVLTGSSEETAGEAEVSEAELPSLEGLTPPEAEAEVPEAEPPSFEGFNTDGPTDASEETAGEDEMPDAELPSLEGFNFPESDNSMEETEALEISMPEGIFKDMENISLDIESGTGGTVADNPDAFSLDSFDAFKFGGNGSTGGSNAAEKYSLDPLDNNIELLSKSSSNIEEIQLSNDELVRLQKTLASYPLNLRIACEQIIAEEGVEPALMSKFIKALTQGASFKEGASLASKILDRNISIPKGFEKKSGEALQAQQASFTYIFVRRVVPILRLFVLVALVAASLFYLIHRFVYTPLYADSIYRKGYERIAAGDYARANERFNEALKLHREKKWFYRYAEGFRDSRQYIFAREKYDLLLVNYPLDKKGVMDYAAMETSLNNYKKADSLLRRNILDYKVDDKDALLAVGDNALAWGDMEPEQYELARHAYARLMERYGWTSPVVERMMKYFIRTDNLKEVLPLQHYFMDNPGNKITSAGLAELGGYLLDKKFEDVQGVPSEYISRIDGIRDILIKAVNADPTQPEPHYHLARYYRYFKNPNDEQITLRNAIGAFDASQEESVRRLNARIDAEQRYAQVLINNREFFAAEEHLLKGIGLYEDALGRQVLSRSPQFGRIYADMGDLEYFTKDGNMGAALEYYIRAEQNGWSPPEMQYRMGSAYYHLGKWASALQRFVEASSDMPFNRRLLNALGNASYMRGNYAIAQGYYNHLLNLLNTDRDRFSVLMPSDRVDHMELAERLMMVRNNFGVTLEALTERTGDTKYRSQAMGLYSESARTWDVLTRDPETMLRMKPGDLPGPGVNLGYLNAQNALHPVSEYEPQIYIQIDKDVLEPSPWEGLTPQNFRLADNIF